MKPERLIRIKSVTALNGFGVRIDFTDDTQRDVGLEPYLHGPIFKPRGEATRYNRIAITPNVCHGQACIKKNNSAHRSVCALAMKIL